MKYRKGWIVYRFARSPGEGELRPIDKTNRVTRDDEHEYHWVPVDDTPPEEPPPTPIEECNAETAEVAAARTHERQRWLLAQVELDTQDRQRTSAKGGSTPRKDVDDKHACIIDA